VINVATGSRISLNDLFTTVKSITGASVTPLYGPTRAGDVRDSLADITLARELLGYVPIVGLEEGLRETVAWYASTQQPA
jgi:nucleoside-diphosphate-sugar epimerase